MSKGHSIIMDESYNITARVFAPKAMLKFNMHEFNVLDEGETALHILGQPEYRDVSELNVGQDAGWVSNMGIREVDTMTGDTKLEWWVLHHVSLRASVFNVTGLNGPHPASWKVHHSRSMIDGSILIQTLYSHANSVDKDSNGDYMLSSRFTDCIYKISGRDGCILWRLGGMNSSFDQDLFSTARREIPPRAQRWQDRSQYFARQRCRFVDQHLERLLCPSGRA